MNKSWEEDRIDVGKRNGDVGSVEEKMDMEIEDRVLKMRKELDKIVNIGRLEEVGLEEFMSEEGWNEIEEDDWKIEKRKKKEIIVIVEEGKEESELKRKLKEWEKMRIGEGKRIVVVEENELEGWENLRKKKSIEEGEKGKRE